MKKKHGIRSPFPAFEAELTNIFELGNDTNRGLFRQELRKTPEK